MMHYWQGLNEREQWAVRIGGIFLIIYLIYLIIFSPLFTAVDSTTAQIKEKSQTLTWMRSVRHQHDSIKSPKPITNSKLLSLIASQLNVAPYQGFHYQMQQTSSGDIQLAFEKIPYNIIMNWLWTLSQNYTVTIKHLGVERLPASSSERRSANGVRTSSDLGEHSCQI